MLLKVNWVKFSLKSEMISFWYTLKALFFYQHHIVLILSPFIVCTFSWFFNDIDDTQSIEALLITKPKTNPKSSYRL